MVAYTLRELQTAIKILHTVYSSFSLAINKNKTKLLVQVASTNKRQKEHLFKLSDSVIEQVGSFKYLGSMLNTTRSD